MGTTVLSEFIERKSVVINVAKLPSLKTLTAVVPSQERRGIYVDMIGQEAWSN